MQSSRSVRGVTIIGAVALLGCGTPPDSAVTERQLALTATAVDRIATLADQGLAELQNAVLPGSITNDRGVRMGSIGSDIFRARGDQGNTFWMTSDRGPNGQPGGRRTFAVPQFAPMILQVKVHGPRIEILDVLPLVGSDGVPVSGLPNLTSDEAAFNFDATLPLGVNPNGIDQEAIVRTAQGDFWLAEEYRPSLVHVDASGRVIKRLVPATAALAGTSYPIADTLPALLKKRRANRGFEGLALIGQERTLVAAVQSPLEHPTRAIGRASRNLRFVRVDIASEQATGEFVYQMEEVCSFLGRPAGCGVAPGDMKVSGLAPVVDGKLLVLERTDDVAKIYLVDLSAATNILGTSWDLPGTSPALEQITDFAAAGVTALQKTLIVDLSTLPNMPKKIEGVTVINPDTIAIANDNDFGLVDETVYDAAGNLANDTGVQSHIIHVKLAAPLPH